MCTKLQHHGSGLPYNISSSERVKAKATQIRDKVGHIFQCGFLFILKWGIKEGQGVINGAYQIYQNHMDTDGIQILCL